MSRRSLDCYVIFNTEHRNQFIDLRGISSTTETSGRVMACLSFNPHFELGASITVLGVIKIVFVYKTDYKL